MVGYDLRGVIVQKIVQGLVFRKVLITGFTLTKEVVVAAVAAHHLLHHNRIFTGLFKSIFAPQIMQIYGVFCNVFSLNNRYF